MKTEELTIEVKAKGLDEIEEQVDRITAKLKEAKSIIDDLAYKPLKLDEEKFKETTLQAIDDIVREFSNKSELE